MNVKQREERVPSHVATLAFFLLVSVFCYMSASGCDAVLTHTDTQVAVNVKQREEIVLLPVATLAPILFISVFYFMSAGGCDAVGTSTNSHLL